MSSPEEAARTAEMEGDLEKALTAWRQLSLKSHDPVHFCRLGYVAVGLKLWTDASSAFINALKVNPRLPEAMQGLGIVNLHRPDGDRVGNFKLANGYFASAFRLQRTARGATLLGMAYAVLHEDELARAAYLEAIDIEPEYEEAFYNLAKIEMERDASKAIELFERAVEIDPNYSLAHQELGKLYQQSGDLVRAEYHLRRSVETNPTDYWSQLFLANLLAVQGKNIEAEHTYRFVTSLQPEMTGGVEFFARFLDSIGKKQQAADLRRNSKAGSSSFNEPGNH